VARLLGAAWGADARPGAETRFPNFVWRAWHQACGVLRALAQLSPPGGASPPPARGASLGERRARKVAASDPAEAEALGASYQVVCWGRSPALTASTRSRSFAASSVKVSGGSMITSAR
jgi:hypothetical protein